MHWMLRAWLCLTLELRLEVPGVGGEAAEHVTPGVLEEQQHGAAPHQAAQHPGEALPVELRGEHQPPGGAGAVRQLKGPTQSKWWGGGLFMDIWSDGYLRCEEHERGEVQQTPHVPPGRLLPAGGQQGGGGGAIRATSRPSATSISRYKHTGDTQEIQSSTQETS